MTPSSLIQSEDVVVVTGAAGFIGAHVVDALLKRGFRNLRCLTRATSQTARLRAVLHAHGCSETLIVPCNLLSPDECRRAADGAALVIHLVAGRGKSFPACFLNSVVATRNLLEACITQPSLRRFVNTSSFSVYSMVPLQPHDILDETCPLEDDFVSRCDAYGYAKRKQDDLVISYQRHHGLPSVTVRPSVVFGPGKAAIPAHVGLSTFGFFMHIGGANRIPLTYVSNCADAIVLAGLTPGLEGEIFNIVDDDLPTSRAYLRQHRRRLGRFFALPIPKPLFHAFCRTWEWYAHWSDGQLPPVLNRRYFAFFWKPLRYSNAKLKQRLGWKPAITMQEALNRYFTSLSEDTDA